MLVVIIIAILGIALVLYLYAQVCNGNEICRSREKAKLNATLYEQRLEREAREVEERCAGKSFEERVRIREEFCARLEADAKRCEKRLREIERQRKAAEQTRRQENEMSPGTKDALLFMIGAAVVGMGKDHDRESRCLSRRKDRSHGCGCDCDDCLEGRHEDCEDDCEIW